MKYLLIGVVVAVFILGYLASKNNDKRAELAAAKAAQSTSAQPIQPERIPSTTPAQASESVGATSYVHSLQRAEQSAKDVSKVQDEYMQKMRQAEQ